MIAPMRLILASTSPRRRDILALLRVPFEVVAPEFDEQVSRHVPLEEEVVEFAFGKARSVASEHPRSIVIGSDTMIEFGGQKIGKPVDRLDASRILRSLSGKTHSIFTGVAIVDGCGGPGVSSMEKVSVKMHPFSEEEIQTYLDCNESFDKAGAYSIQGEGSRLIRSLCGDYLAAVGMPLRSIAAYLKGRGFSLFDIDRLYAEKPFINWGRFSR